MCVLVCLQIAAHGTSFRGGDATTTLGGHGLEFEQALLREGEIDTLTYTGAPDDIVFGMISFRPDHVAQPGKTGVLHVSYPLIRFSLDFRVDELGPGTDAIAISVQALVQDDDGVKLSAPSMTVLADAGL